MVRSRLSRLSTKAFRAVSSGPVAAGGSGRENPYLAGSAFMPLVQWEKLLCEYRDSLDGAHRPYAVVDDGDCDSVLLYIPWSRGNGTLLGCSLITVLNAVIFLLKLSGAVITWVLNWCLVLICELLVYAVPLGWRHPKEATALVASALLAIWILPGFHSATMKANPEKEHVVPAVTRILQPAPPLLDHSKESVVVDRLAPSRKQDKNPIRAFEPSAPPIEPHVQVEAGGRTGEQSSPENPPKKKEPWKATDLTPPKSDEMQAGHINRSMKQDQIPSTNGETRKE